MSLPQDSSVIAGFNPANSSTDQGSSAISTASPSSNSATTTAAPSPSITDQRHKDAPPNEIVVLSTYYLDVSAKPIPTWVDSWLGNLTFEPNSPPDKNGSGLMHYPGPACGEPWNNDGWEEPKDMTASQAEAWMQSYSAVSSAVNAAAGQGHPNQSLVGTAVGGFVGGVVVAAAIGVGFWILRRRKERREQRGSRIQSSFEQKLAGAPAFEDIALSTNNEQKPLTSADVESVVAVQAPSRASHRRSSTALSIDAGSVRNIAVTSGKQAANSEKGQSFPTTLLSRKPNRALSISAAGLISPVAASYPASKKEGLDEIIKHLRTEVSILFEQIELHVDNFYHASLVNQSQTISQVEQDKLRLIDSPHLEDSVIALIAEAHDVRVLLKHCLCALITSRIEYTGRVEANETLLPPSLVTIYRLMAASTKGNSTQAISQWRTQTLGLLGIDNIEKSMAAWVRDLSGLVISAFKPWAVARFGTEARCSHLASVLRQAVEIGLEVFGMQGRAIWVWESADGNGQVVVTPGFLVQPDFVDGEAGAHEVEVLRPMTASL